jgi:hypothetical protein
LSPPPQTHTYTHRNDAMAAEESKAAPWIDVWGCCMIRPRMGEGGRNERFFSVLGIKSVRCFMLKLSFVCIEPELPDSAVSYYSGTPMYLTFSSQVKGHA